MISNFKPAATVVALTGLIAFGAACSDDDNENPPPTPTTVVDIAVNAGTFTTLVGALQATGLDATLSGDGPFTVFAPSDDAFNRLPDGLVASLDSETLTSILTYHVVSGDVRAEDVVGLTEATTVNGADISIDATGGVWLNGLVEVVSTDLTADNGVVHVIDSVLLPGDFPGTLVDALSAHPRFDTLVGAVASAELVATLASDNGGDGFTVFAPTNAAFEALGVDLSTLTTEQLADILLYHTVPATVDAATVLGLTSATTAQGSDISIAIENGSVMLNGDIKVIRTDFTANNGIIHVIDGVLLPPSN